MQITRVLGVVVLLATAAMAQYVGPITYNQAGGYVNFSASVDTTAQMQYCQGSIEANGQCSGSWVWYFHTGTVTLTATNRRTNQTVTANQQKTGGIASYSVNLSAQPGDIIDYTETETVYCPAIAAFVTNLSYTWQLEVAYTLVQYTGGPRGACTTIAGSVYCAYPVRNWCNAATTPPDADFTNKTVSDLKVYGYWNTYSICLSPTGSKPWSCLNGIASGSNASLSPASCTSSY